MTNNRPVPSVVSSGKTPAALSAFGSVLVVSAVIWVVGGLSELPERGRLPLLPGVVGALVATALWLIGKRQLAVGLHLVGLCAAATIAFASSGSTGGAVGILLLAIVITGGGLMGERGAALGTLLAGAALVGGAHLGPRLLVLLDATQPLPPELVEPALAAFVVSSVPCWGLFAAALARAARDDSAAALRRAADLEASLRDLHAKLARHQQAVARGVIAERRAERVAALARTCVGDRSVDEVLRVAAESLRREVPQLASPRSLRALLNMDLTGPLPGDPSPDDANHVREVMQLVRLRLERTTPDEVSE